MTISAIKNGMVIASETGAEFRSNSITIDS